MNDRIRRVHRITRNAPVSAVTARQHGAMVDDLKLIAEVQKSIEHSRRTIAEAELRLFNAMQKAKMDTLEEGDMVAEIAASAGKGSYYVDPKSLRKRLTDDKDFYDCVAVSVTKAKQYLSGKEFTAMAKFTPGVTGEKKIKVFVKEPKKAKPSRA